MVDFEIDGTVILLLGILIIGAVLISGNALAGIVDWFEDINNDQNRNTNYYDLTCEFRLDNRIGFDVRIMDMFNGEASTQCFQKKSGLFFSILPWPKDEGNVRLSAQNKEVYANYDIDEGSNQKFVMTLRRLEVGETQTKITVFDDLGRTIDSKTLNINVGDIQ